MGAGSSVEATWTPEADSVTRPGEKCIMSGPISGISMDDLWEFTVKHIHTKPFQENNFIKHRTVKEQLDGSLLEISHIEAGDIKMNTHVVTQFDRENKKITMTFYHTDETLTKPMSVGVITFLQDPELRVEYIVDEKETRQAGPILRNALATQLAAMDCPVECKFEVPSPFEEGKKCCLSAEISNPALTKETFWQKFKEALEEKRSGASLPDGSVVVEDAGFVSTSYLKFSYLADKDEIICQDFQQDESLQTVELSSFYKFHDSPKRVEAWAITRECRRASGNTLGSVDAFFKSVLKSAGEKES